MLMEVKNIIGLPVFIEAGLLVGKVVDVELDIDLHAVKNYRISKKWFGTSFLVAPKQVKSITLKKMVVSDASVPSISKKNKAPLPEANLGGAMTRSE